MKGEAARAELGNFLQLGHGAFGQVDHCGHRIGLGQPTERRRRRGAGVRGRVLLGRGENAA